jgi:hypothetical protein
MSGAKTAVVVALVVAIAVLVGYAVYSYVTNNPSGGGASCATTPCEKGTCSKDGSTCVKCTDATAGACPNGRTCDAASGNCASCNDPGAAPCKAGTQCNVTTGNCDTGTSCDGSNPCPSGSVCTAGQCVPIGPPSGTKYNVRFVPDGADVDDESQHVVLCCCRNNGGGAPHQAGRFFDSKLNYNVANGACTEMIVTMEGSGHNGVGPGFALKDSVSGLYLDAATGRPTHSSATDPAALLYNNDAFHMWPVGAQHNVGISVGSDGAGNNTLNWVVADPYVYAPSQWTRVYLKPVATAALFSAQASQWWSDSSRRGARFYTVGDHPGAAGAASGCGSGSDSGCAALAEFPPK